MKVASTAMIFTRPALTSGTPAHLDAIKQKIDKKSFLSWRSGLLKDLFKYLTNMSLRMLQMKVLKDVRIK